MVYDNHVPMRIALKALMMNKTTYYYEPSPEMDCRVKPLDPALVSMLRQMQGYVLVYGYRKVTNLFDVFNHKKIYRHMKALGMQQPRKLKKKNTPRLPISCATEPNVRWESDLTYVWDGTKMNYLFAVVDTYDKEPIGDYYGLRCRAEEAINALEEAVELRFGSLEPCDTERVKMRVDQGSQFIAEKFKQRAKELGVRLEYCGIECPDDKPYIECFFARYKCEEVYRNEYGSYTRALLGWVQYKQWYKTERIHQGLGWITIPEFKEDKSRGFINQEVFQSKNIGA